MGVRGRSGVGTREESVRVEEWDGAGTVIGQEVGGLSAGTCQHESDHLFGTRFVDRVEDTKTLCTRDAFDRHHRAGFVARVEALVARFGT